jgi:hypothetical protein
MLSGKQMESIVPHYRVWSIEGTENYWILAVSENEAKTLVALSVPSIVVGGAKLECIVDAKFAPPLGVIITDSGETLAAKG